MKRLAILLTIVIVTGCAGDTLRQSQALIESGNEEQGLERLEQALREHPDDVELRSYYLRHRAVAVQRYLQTGDNARAAGAQRQLVSQLLEQPGVRAVALGTHFPGNESPLRSVSIDHHPDVSQTARVVEIGPGLGALTGPVGGRGGTPREQPCQQHARLDLGAGDGSIFGGSRTVALDTAPRRGFVRGDGTALPFRCGAFGTVIALDVLEHVDYPQEALGEACRVTRPGGLLIITVPALRQLWSDWDVALHHRRRERVKRKVLGCGEVEADADIADRNGCVTKR